VVASAVGIEQLLNCITLRSIFPNEQGAHWVDVRISGIVNDCKEKEIN
jgi:hypothetical protein